MTGRPDGLVARGLRVSFGPTTVLDGIDLDLAPGEVLALVGASGSGKSTLLRCLAGLQRPDQGSVHLGGRDIVRSSDAERAAVRRRSFGFVFQFGELVPELTMAENIGLPLELNGYRRVDRRARVRELADRLDIADVLSRRSHEVSGGQAQRAAVARAVAHRPAVVFADEPTGALDTANGDRVLEAVLDVARQDGGAVVLVTHEARLAAQADRLVTVADGRVASVPGG